MEGSRRAAGGGRHLDESKRGDDLDEDEDEREGKAEDVPDRPTEGDGRSAEGDGRSATDEREGQRGGQRRDES